MITGDKDDIPRRDGSSNTFLTEIRIMQKRSRCSSGLRLQRMRSKFLRPLRWLVSMAGVFLLAWQAGTAFAASPQARKKTPVKKEESQSACKTGLMTLDQLGKMLESMKNGGMDENRVKYCMEQSKLDFPPTAENLGVLHNKR